MKKEAKILAIVVVVGIVLILSVGFVSASLLGDVGNWFGKLFGVNNQNNLNGQLGSSGIVATQTAYGCQGQCAVGAKGCDANAANRLACEMQPNGCRGWNSYPCQYGCNRGTGLCNPPPQPCVPQSCSSLGRVCGPDNCGTPDACGKCTLPKTCNSNGQCVCIPQTCSQLGKICGSWPDGCGGTLNCGTCPSPQTCNPQGTACITTCGNGVKDPGEECDPGKYCVYSIPNGNGGTFFSRPIYDCTNDASVCTKLTNSPAGGGNIWSCELVNTDDCTAQCKYTFCGDGIAQWPNHNKQNEDCDNQRGTDPAACHTGTALNNVYCINENYASNPYADKTRVDWCTTSCKNPIPPCIPKTCSSLGKKCGSYSDGCGNILNCGTCPYPTNCNPSTGNCETPVCSPQCNLCQDCKLMNPGSQNPLYQCVNKAKQTVPPQTGACMFTSSTKGCCDGSGNCISCGCDPTKTGANSECPTCQFCKTNSPSDLYGTCTPVVFDKNPGPACIIGGVNGVCCKDGSTANNIFCSNLKSASGSSICPVCTNVTGPCTCVECDPQHQCPGTLKCAGGKCVPECINDNDCNLIPGSNIVSVTKTKICKNKQCIPIECPPNKNCYDKNQICKDGHCIDPLGNSYPFCQNDPDCSSRGDGHFLCYFGGCVQCPNPDDCNYIYRQIYPDGVTGTQPSSCTANSNSCPASWCSGNNCQKCGNSCKYPYQNLVNGVCTCFIRNQVIKNIIVFNASTKTFSQEPGPCVCKKNMKADAFGDCVCIDDNAYTQFGTCLCPTTKGFQKDPNEFGQCVCQAGKIQVGGECKCINGQDTPDCHVDLIKNICTASIKWTKPTAFQNIVCPPDGIITFGCKPWTCYNYAGDHCDMSTSSTSSGTTPNTGSSASTNSLECGEWSDGCGGKISCGTCNDTYICKQEKGNDGIYVQRIYKVSSVCYQGKCKPSPDYLNPVGSASNPQGEPFMIEDCGQCGICMPECTKDEDCPSGQKCNLPRTIVPGMDLSQYYKCVDCSASENCNRDTCKNCNGQCPPDSQNSDRIFDFGQTKPICNNLNENDPCIGYQEKTSTSLKPSCASCGCSSAASQTSWVCKKTQLGLSQSSSASGKLQCVKQVSKASDCGGTCIPGQPCSADVNIYKGKGYQGKIKIPWLYLQSGPSGGLVSAPYDMIASTLYIKTVIDSYGREVLSEWSEDNTKWTSIASTLSSYFPISLSDDSKQYDDSFERKIIPSAPNSQNLPIYKTNLETLIGLAGLTDGDLKNLVQTAIANRYNKNLVAGKPDNTPFTGQGFIKDDPNYNNFISSCANGIGSEPDLFLRAYKYESCYDFEKARIILDGVATNGQTGAIKAKAFNNVVGVYLALSIINKKTPNNPDLILALNRASNAIYRDPTNSLYQSTLRQLKLSLLDSIIFAWSNKNKDALNFLSSQTQYNLNGVTRASGGCHVNTYDLIDRVAQTMSDNNKFIDGITAIKTLVGHDVNMDNYVKLGLLDQEDIFVKSIGAADVVGWDKIEAAFDKDVVQPNPDCSDHSDSWNNMGELARSMFRRCYLNKIKNDQVAYGAYCDANKFRDAANFAMRLSDVLNVITAADTGKANIWSKYTQLDNDKCGDQELDIRNRNREAFNYEGNFKFLTGKGYANNLIPEKVLDWLGMNFFNSIEGPLMFVPTLSGLAEVKIAFVGGSVSSAGRASLEARLFAEDGLINIGGDEFKAITTFAGKNNIAVTEAIEVSSEGNILGKRLVFTTQQDAQKFVNLAKSQGIADANGNAITISQDGTSISGKNIKMSLTTDIPAADYVKAMEAIQVEDYAAACARRLNSIPVPDYLNNPDLTDLEKAQIAKTSNFLDFKTPNGNTISAINVRDEIAKIEASASDSRVLEGAGITGQDSLKAEFGQLPSVQSTEKSSLDALSAHVKDHFTLTQKAMKPGELEGLIGDVKSGEVSTFVDEDFQQFYRELDKAIRGEPSGISEIQVWDMDKIAANAEKYGYQLYERNWGSAPIRGVDVNYVAIVKWKGPNSLNCIYYEVQIKHCGGAIKYTTAYPLPGQAGVKLWVIPQPFDGTTAKAAEGVMRGILSTVPTP